MDFISSISLIYIWTQKKIIYSQPKTELAGQHGFFFSYQQMAAVTRNVKTAMTAPTC
jgi:hypothetical protein